MEKIRLQKFFTDAGVMSRRAAEKEIIDGRVRVNGLVAQLGDRVDPELDTVEYKGKIIPYRNGELTYIMLNKPVGCVTTADDEKGRKNVVELVSSLGKRVYPVGRLDMNSDGLLLLTDDGELANKLTHPRHNIPKIYRVNVTKAPTEEQLAILRSPLLLDGYRIQPVKTEVISSGDGALMEMTLFEGRNRQIRRMCEVAGLKISRLTRIAIGDLKLGTLPTGKWRHLTSDEIEYLKNEG
ncbi:MAG: rRNA pseudouridine synthase [Clostridia bacterium]|nr:rRNA pseudouridine synthase [Clostridia bacterium]